ncbi:MAG: GAF domain-containing protein, partial [Thermotogae bacterium]|nr:GAF domain-containing protein [Thermotogota bacterium]
MLTNFEQILEIFNQNNFENRLKILSDLIRSMSGSVFVCLYVYEEEHKQLRLMFSSDNLKPEEYKIKIDTLNSELSSPFEYKGKMAIPISSLSPLIGLVAIDTGKTLDPFQCSQIATLLKILLEDESNRATMSKLVAMEKLDNEIGTVSTNIDELYKKVLDFAVEVSNAERGTIWLIGDRELILSYTSGISQEEIIKRRIEIGYGMVGWIAQSKEPLLSTSSKIDPRATLDIFAFPVKSTIG